MTTRPVITLANSIIGVSILAMPFCFKQCGIILATIMLLLCGMLVKVTCHLLIKSALLARRKNFELLAFHTFGHLGKLCIEIGISGFLGGTAIAFFVVMGDLGPPLTANFLSIENSANLRLVILTGLGLFVALPLSMMRNIESLSVICASSIGFYLLVVLRVVLQAVPNLISGEWMNLVNLWRPAGMLQCFPIFSMALSCQANVFEVYGSLKEATPGDMNDVVRGAVNLCSAIYITIGFFGYVSFCHIENLSGNILTAFPQSHMLDVVKFGFLTSVAVSFPLVIFPCRTSIHSLLFRKTYRGIESTELVTDYITPIHFNLITLAIIVFSLIIGILIPDIELVLGLVGSTMGASICVVFPAAVFLSLTTKNTTERVAAKAICVIGIVTMILGTYVNLFEPSTSSPATTPNPSLIKPTIEPLNVLNPAKIGGETADNVLKNISDAAAKFEKKKVDSGAGDTEKKKDSGEAPKQRQEPANPVPPNETVPPASKEDQGGVKDNGTGNVKAKDKVIPVVEKESKEKGGVKEEKKEMKPDKIKGREKKEDTEKKESTETKKSKAETEKEAEKLLAQLEKQKKEQQNILQQQKEILNDLKIHQEKERMAEEKKAIVDAVQQYNLQGAGVMQQHIPANPQQVQANPQQAQPNPQQPQVNQQQVPVQQQQQQPVDNVGQPQPVFQQQQFVPQVVPQVIQQVPVQQQQQQPLNPQQPAIQPVQMGAQPQQQPVVPQVVQQQVPPQVNQQQMVPQQQQQQQPVVQPQQPIVQSQQQQFAQPQQQQFAQSQQQQFAQPQKQQQQQQQQYVQQVPQVVPQVIQQVPVQGAPQQQPQAPNVPLQQQNMQGAGIAQQNVQPQPAQAVQQVPQQQVMNQPVAPAAAVNSQQQQQDLPQQQQQIPQKPIETIVKNPAPKEDPIPGKHEVADYDSIHKEEEGEAGDKQKKHDAKVPGRDLKDDKEGTIREKRNIICENDPDCDEKFQVDFNSKAISGIGVASRDLLEFKGDSVK